MDLLEKGGIFMIPIAVFSIMAVAVFLERLWMLRKSRILPYESLREAEVLIHRRAFTEARALCQQKRSPPAQILLAGLKNPLASRQIVQEKLEAGGRPRPSSSGRGSVSCRRSRP